MIGYVADNLHYSLNDLGLAFAIYKEHCHLYISASYQTLFTQRNI